MTLWVGVRILSVLPMSHTIEFTSAKIYGLVISRTGISTDIKMTSLLFFQSRQEAEAAAIKNGSRDVHSDLKAECAIIECDLHAAFADGAFIVPNDYCVNNFHPTK